MAIDTRLCEILKLNELILEEELNRWKNQDVVQQYFERARYDLLNDEKDSHVAINIDLQSNYGFILKTKEHFTESDHKILYMYLYMNLKEYGYRLSSEKEGEMVLQASVKERVKGNQLFGTIRLIDKEYEIRVLVVPYNGAGYEEGAGREKLLEVLFY